ncbi:MAG: hypothetical protein J7M26_04355 [Armatimonadetes bacterium]|nr:hypothetical protein [Armatimonadota bacterium]
MTSREIITRVLTYDRPERIGLTYSPYQGQPRINDVIGVGPKADPNSRATPWEDDGAGGEVRWDEWGCLWRRIKGKTTGGEVQLAPIQCWEDLDHYEPPTLDDPARYEHIPEVRQNHPDKYMLGSIVACAFNKARYLRRLEQYLLDLAEQPEQVKRLNRLVSDLVLAQVDLYADAGADGVFFCEDWGTEDRLLVSPAMWDEIFRPDFERLIEHAHSRGLTVWMHSCGYVRDIIPHLVDLGMDVLQFDQPELSDLDFLAEFSGRVTYWCPVDIQKVLPTGDKALIQSRAREMLRKLASQGGGFIAKDYPDNHSIGVDPLWQHWGYEIFVAEGKYAEVAAS